MANNIHSTAIISDNAEIGKNVKIGPYSVIGDDVYIGDNTEIMSHVTVNEYVKMGKNNKIYSHADIGQVPQDLGFNNERSWVDIGNNNIIREYSTIHRSSKKDKKTIIGDNNFLMAYSHVAHDCILGNDIKLVNYAGISGHVEIEDKAFISGGVLVHQFVKIGKMTMIGGGSKLTQDVLPFTLVDGNPAKVFGLNIVGIRRNNISKNTRKKIKKVLKIALEYKNKNKILNNINDTDLENNEAVKHFLNFIRKSERGLLVRKK